ncbi:MAG: RnfABCDGE type electron transport complex subunit D [Bacteroidales bacterium]|nr:RnfABCDGE type electron transport complex subunit D [Bacteroidales bacterium]MBR6330465.1 RnfABCDGE type electron transport complex subunit D [Bacteroidales bacterium]
MKLLNVSGSPHVHSDESTKKIMWRVNLALVPSLIVAIAFFGLNALLISLISVASCVLFQWLIEKFILKTPSTISDGSAVVTGLLLAFNVPATREMILLVIIAALVAIGIGKMSFGGLGKNPFNPALVGRVFMLISFPVQMTTWPKPGENLFSMVSQPTTDATTGATPLGLIKENGVQAAGQVWDYFVGNVGGSLGEVSALAILIGAIYLLCRRIISWHIPVSFIGTAFIFSGILWLCDKTAFVDPLTTILTGGIMLGACFMATDMVTSPMTKAGQLVFGFGCGLLTIIIRNWGNYPEGVSFAILLMNAVTPLLNRWFKPKRFAN